MFSIVVRCERTPPVDEGVQLQDTYNQGKKIDGIQTAGKFHEYLKDY